MMNMREKQLPAWRKCQFCKQQRDCSYVADPFLFYNFDEIEMVWLCDECYSIRERGDHLDNIDEEWWPA